MGQTRWKRRPQGSTWGDYGDDDELGRVNLLTPEKVKQGIAEVREGIAFCLSLPLDVPGGAVVNPRRHPPVLRPTLRGNVPSYLYRMENDDPLASDVVDDDAAVIHLQYSTQWDSLAHVGQLFDASESGHPEPTFYNGYRGGSDIVGPEDGAQAGAIGTFEAVSTACAKHLGIEHLARKGMQGRAVMIDLERHFGKTRVLVTYDQLERVMLADNVVVEPGDMVCLYTGWSDVLLAMNKQPNIDVLNNACAALDGRDERLLEWVTDTQLVALIADNYAVEALPPRPSNVRAPALPLHAHCLFKIGVNLGELWYFGELGPWLRDRKRSRFLLTAPPLRLPGAVGSPVTPIATV